LNGGALTYREKMEVSLLKSYVQIKIRENIEKTIIAKYTQAMEPDITKAIKEKKKEMDAENLNPFSMGDKTDGKVCLGCGQGETFEISSS